MHSITQKTSQESSFWCSKKLSVLLVPSQCLGDVHSGIQAQFVTYGGFHKWGYPKMDGLQWKIPLKWMVTGSITVKPPYEQSF